MEPASPHQENRGQYETPLQDNVNPTPGAPLKDRSQREIRTISPIVRRILTYPEEKEES